MYSSPALHSPRRRLFDDLLLITLLTLPLLWAGLGNHHFWLNDEPFVAETAREMYAGGSLSVPTLNGEPFLEKPPLHYWLVAASFRLFGVTPVAARLPSALAVLFTIFATYFLGRRLCGRQAGRWAALLLPTFYLIFYIGHYCLVDATLMLLVTLALLAGSHALGGDRRSWALPVLYGCMALAFLAKGFVGPLMITIAILGFAIRQSDADFLRDRRHLLGAAGLLGVIAGWAGLLYAAGGGAFVREALLANSLGRLFPLTSYLPQHDGLGTHAGPFYYYLTHLCGNIAPWTPALIFLLLPLKWRRGGTEPESAGAGLDWGRKFLIVALLANLIALSFAHSKRGMYLAPLFPLLACLIAAEADALSRVTGAYSSAARWFAGVQTGLVSLFTLACASGYLYIIKRVNGAAPKPADWALTGVLVLAAVTGIVISSRYFMQHKLRVLFRVNWIQTALSLLVIALFCFPRLEPQKGFHRFFSQARVVLATRDTYPALAVNNESYTGLACLYFDRVLQRLVIGAIPLSTAGTSAAVPEFVIADDWGLAQIDGQRPYEVVLKEEIGGPRFKRALYLLRLSAHQAADPRSQYSPYSTLQK